MKLSPSTSLKPKIGDREDVGGRILRNVITLLEPLGASLTWVTVSEVKAGVLLAVPSFTVHMIVRVAPGSLLVEFEADLAKNAFICGDRGAAGQAENAGARAVAERDARESAAGKAVDR